GTGRETEAMNDCFSLPTRSAVSGPQVELTVSESAIGTTGLMPGGWLVTRPPPPARPDCPGQMSPQRSLSLGCVKLMYSSRLLECLTLEKNVKSGSPGGLRRGRGYPVRDLILQGRNAHEVPSPRAIRHPGERDRARRVADRRPLTDRKSTRLNSSHV